MKLKGNKTVVSPEKLRIQDQYLKWFSKNKEELYEEVSNCKQEIRLLRKERNFMKTRLRDIRENLSNSDKAIQRLIKKIRTKNGQESYANSMSFLQALKKHNRQLLNKNQEITTKLSELQRNIKFANTDNMKVKARVYMEKCVKLRKMLECKEKSNCSRTSIGTLKKSEEQRKSRKELLESHDKDIKILKEQFNLLAKEVKSKARDLSEEKDSIHISKDREAKEQRIVESVVTQKISEEEVLIPITQLKITLIDLNILASDLLNVSIQIHYSSYYSQDVKTTL